jgi:hypothetical protein
MQIKCDADPNSSLELLTTLAAQAKTNSKLTPLATKAIRQNPTLWKSALEICLSSTPRGSLPKKSLSISSEKYWAMYSNLGICRLQIFSASDALKEVH